MRRKRRQSEKQTQFVLSLSRLSEQVALDYCLAIPSSLRSSLRVPSSAPASSQGDIYHGKRYRLPFIFTPATRRRSKAFGFDFLTKNLSLSLAPPLSPKQISASLPHFVCFIFNKKFPPLLVGIFISFADF